MKILVAGIIARYPFGGVTWCSLMYLLGLRALGHDVFYIEDTGECVYDPEQNTRSTDPAYGTSYIQRALAHIQEAAVAVNGVGRARTVWQLLEDLTKLKHDSDDLRQESPGRSAIRPRH